uniref:carbonic anhydrase n=1 Tax=Hemiselmis tepida TaxID=464990 RepID=A0A7S0V3E2_9CRYP|mmetsp:Transcript_11720/g.30365  ORF Transcript_11720/g.30365 Transcript_11720/m.30365 type:complete len:316 (+) Transcript_11720:56-1003(+)
MQKQDEERPPSMVPLATLVAMLGLMFVFVLAILGVVGDMHANGVWEKTCPVCSGNQAVTECPTLPGTWSYAKADDWGGTCSSGSSQSPINIATADAAGGAAADTYTPIFVGSFTTASVGGDFLRRAFLEIKDETVTVSDIWTTFKWSGRDWKFQTLKMHFPSEHTIDSKQYEVEIAMHYIDTSGKHMIMSFLGDRVGDVAGESPRFIADVADLAADNMGMRIMQLDFSEAMVGLRTKCIPTTADGSDDCLSNRESAYYGYTGSLSIPPCTEGVERLVMKEPFKIRDEDYDELTKLTSGNARPVQDLNDRKVVKVE